MTMPTRNPPGGGGAGRWVVRCVVLLARLLALLRPRLLGRLLRLLAGGARPAGYDEALLARRSVVSVSPYCAGWRGCLPRSIAICLLCRRSGCWPLWSVGVRATPPFAAHAWVEAAGRMVGEPGPRAAYRALLQVPAGPAER
jgi:hypothetical protein